MTDRSSNAHVINPVLALPAAQRLIDLHPDARAALADLLKDLSKDARQRAQKSWRSNKGPMAVYWKAVGAYATHLYRVVRLHRSGPC
ncbi:hypothetical protein RLPCCGM1_c1304 [Rhizobium leguminosarum bv. phaseoli CCGM1]|uniref:hypothetical protein n=1 Tax=Rhizobium phaseoli TaxID=396 RepID=UPI0004D6D9F8|nr:hypothetical protein [Rhizobium phaseoli]KEC73188.1 hypothetical protein RLPCCGM1_c1304 [Rhizobium leguminosarum bv. phaseoli CCGM1]PWI54156.1 hypothetical protein B5K03_11995 [Rhizobium phaseoli]